MEQANLSAIEYAKWCRKDIDAVRVRLQTRASEDRMDLDPT
jgi:hypothetical protein